MKGARVDYWVDMVSGVGVHTVLLVRWLAHMTRRIASADRKRSGRVAPASWSDSNAAGRTAAARANSRHTRKAFQTGADDSGYGSGSQDSGAGGGSTGNGGSSSSSGGVTAQNADACGLCGRCTQVCRLEVITLNG